MAKPSLELSADGGDVEPELVTQDRRTVLARTFDPSFILGAVCTGAFYTVILQPSMRGSVLYHYTTEHNVEYAVVALFIWGLVDMALKVLDFPKEFLALRRDWLPSRMGREPASNAQILLAQIQARPRWMQDSKLGKRLTEALEYVVELGSADNYREHLQYLSEQDQDATHSNYMLGRFVITVTPVLGFLGTVVHFGTALSGISFDEMTERLPVIVGEMGTAFNTTTVALTAAMTLMFLVFICERVERGIVRSVDRIVERELLSRFEVKDPNIVPFLSAVQSASEETMQVIATTLERQIDVWSRSLESLFQRFDARHQQEAQGWHGALEVLQQRYEAYDENREDRLRQLLAHLETRQDQHMLQIQASLEKNLSFRNDFAEFAKTLEGIARGEGKLVELQAALTTNLRVLHETQQFDEALHGLTAAIHLLTARHRQTGPFGAAAA